MEIISMKFDLKISKVNYFDISKSILHFYKNHSYRYKNLIKSLYQFINGLSESYLIIIKLKNYL